MSGAKPSPNSFCRRSASAGLRTEPNTRNPFETSTFVVPQPIPGETPVATTSWLFAIALLLCAAKTGEVLVAAAYCLPFLSSAPHGRHYLRQEPDAVVPLVRIRGGGCEHS